MGRVGIFLTATALLAGCMGFGPPVSTVEADMRAWLAANRPDAPPMEIDVGYPHRIGSGDLVIVPVILEPKNPALKVDERSVIKQDLLYRSLDGGKNWQPVSGFLGLSEQGLPYRFPYPESARPTPPSPPDERAQAGHRQSQDPLH